MSVVRRSKRVVLCGRPNIAGNVSRLKNCGVNSTPSQYKYNQNFKLNNCAISKIPETSHIFKPLLNAVLYFRNLKDNATFYRKVWFSAFHCHANLICRAKFGFPQRIFNTKLFGKVRFRFHLSRKSFRQVFLKLSNRKIGAKRSA